MATWWRREMIRIIHQIGHDEAHFSIGQKQKCVVHTMYGYLMKEAKDQNHSPNRAPWAHFSIGHKQKSAVHTIYIWIFFLLIVVCFLAAAKWLLIHGDGDLCYHQKLSWCQSLPLLHYCTIQNHWSHTHCWILIARILTFLNVTKKWLWYIQHWPYLWTNKVTAQNWNTG